MTTTPAPSASEPAHRKATALARAAATIYRTKAPDTAELSVRDMLYGFILSLESAARPAPGTPEKARPDPHRKRWPTENEIYYLAQEFADDQYDIADAPKMIAFFSFVCERATSQEPINPAQTDRSWPTAERVREHSRAYTVQQHGHVGRGEHVAHGYAGFFEFVRERERAGKGEPKAEPAPERNWRDECVTGSKGGDRWWLRWTDDAGLYWWYHPDTDWVGEPQQLTQPTFASRHEAWRHRKTCSVPPPLVMVPEDAPTAAAPGDEAAREAIKSALSNNGGPIDAESTVDGVAYVMVRAEDFKALEVVLSRFPRPADSRERERADRAKFWVMIETLENALKMALDHIDPATDPTDRSEALRVGRAALAAVLGKGEGC